MAKEKRTQMYSTRNSITSRMKRMGIKKDDYDTFIKKMGSKQFVFLFADAEDYLLELKDKEPKKEPKKPRKQKEPKEPKSVIEKKSSVKKITITGMCCEMILEGKDNASIFKALQDHFGKDRVGDNKKYYVTWNRCLLRREGKLPPAIDAIRQDKTAIHKVED